MRLPLVIFLSVATGFALGELWPLRAPPRPAGSPQAAGDIPHATATNPPVAQIKKPASGVARSAADESGEGEAPAWEQTLSKKLRTIASDAQIMDNVGVFERSVGQLQESLSVYSLDELSAMAQDLADPKKGSIQRAVIFPAVLSEMATRSPEKALHFLMEGLTEEMRRDGGAAKFVFQAIARKDLGYLSSWLAKNTTEWTKPDGDLSEGIKVLAAVSADAAFGFIAAAPPSANRDLLYATAFLKLGEVNLASATSELQRIDPRYRPDAIGAIARGLGTVNSQAAIDFLKKNKDTPIQPYVLQTIFSAWYAKDQAAALENLKSLPEPMLVNILSDVSTMNRLQRKDPDATLDLLSKLVPTRSNTWIIVQNLGWMLDQSSDRIVAWLDAQTADYSNLGLQTQTYSIWAQQKPEAAFAALQARPSLLQNEEIVAGLAHGMAGNPLSETLQWSQKLPMEQRDRFQQAAIGFAAEKQPRAVMEYLAAQPNGGSPELYQKLGGSLAALDVNEAKNWSQRQTGKLGEAAVAGVVAGLMKSDAQGASVWLAQLPAGPTRNAGIKVLVDEIAETDPVAAAQWRKNLSGQ